jgi:hypothetical protein
VPGLEPKRVEENVHCTHTLRTTNTTCNTTHNTQYHTHALIKSPSASPLGQLYFIKRCALGLLNYGCHVLSN